MLEFQPAALALAVGSIVDGDAFPVLLRRPRFREPVNSVRIATGDGKTTWASALSSHSSMSFMHIRAACSRLSECKLSKNSAWKGQEAVSQKPEQGCEAGHLQEQTVHTATTTRLFHRILAHVSAGQHLSRRGRVLNHSTISPHVESFGLAPIEPRVVLFDLAGNEGLTAARQTNHDKNELVMVERHNTPAILVHASV